MRRRVAGVSMLAAPLLLVVVAAISPENSSNAKRQLAVVARHPDRWYVSDLLAVVALCLLVPAILGLMHMLRERGAAYGHVGGALALVGVVAVAIQTALGLVEWQMTKGGADRAQMAALLHRIENSAAIAPLLLAAALLAVGLAVLALGLYRVRAVQWWTAAGLAAGAITVDVAFELPSGVLTIAASAVTALALGAIGLRLLQAPDERWRDDRSAGILRGA